MGFLRSGAIVILTSVLFLSLLLGSMFLTLNWSLEYETIQPEIISISQQLTQDLGITKQIEDNLFIMQNYCSLYPSYTFNESGINFELPCDVINAGTQSILTYSIETIFYQAYYKNYDCSLFTCLKETKDPLAVTVLISEQSKDYWKSKFNLTLIALIIIFILLILLMKDKASAPLVTGIFMIIASFLTKQFNWIIKLFPESPLSGFLGLFFTKANSVFTIMLTIGIILIILGIILKLVLYGWKVSSIFQRKSQMQEDVKEIVQEEIQKTNIQPPQKIQEKQISKIKKDNNSPLQKKTPKKK